MKPECMPGDMTKQELMVVNAEQDICRHLAGTWLKHQFHGLHGL